MKAAIFVFVCVFFISKTFSQSISVSLNDVSCFAGDTIIIPIYTMNFNNIGAITLQIQYEEQKLKFIEEQNWNTQLSGALLGRETNKIIIAWDGLNSINMTSGKLVELKFLFLENSELKFIKNESEIADVNGNPLNVSYRDCIISKIPSPGIPVLTFPINQEKNSNLTPELRWEETPNAAAYHIQVAEDSLFLEKILDLTGITSNKLQLEGLDYNKFYYWRVKASNSSGESSFSEYYCFKTLLPVPDTVQIISPVNMSVLDTGIVRLMWNASVYADKYYIFISYDSLFNRFFLIDSCSCTSYDITNVNEGIRYYWKVNAINNSGISNETVIRFFTLKLNSPDSLKTKIVENKNVELTWRDNSESEIGFIVYRKLGIEVEFLILDTISSNETSFIDTTITKTSICTYKILSYNLVSTSDFSNESSSNVVISSVEDHNTKPEEYQLYQNYPNPFNPTTKICFTIPVQSSVQVSIINSIGQVVNEITDQTYDSGQYEITWNAYKSVSGIYFCRIEAKALDGSRNYINIIKMTLLK